MAASPVRPLGTTRGYRVDELRAMLPPSMEHEWVDTLEAETTDRTPPADSPGGPLKLMVLREGANTVSTHLLPSSGQVRIGRAQDSDVLLVDASISRNHAVLHIDTSPDGGVQIAVEDLGSSNGTRISGQPIGANETATVQLGEAIDLGSVMLTIQRTTSATKVRRVWGHGDLEPRLEEECERARQTRVPFALVRLGVSDDRDTEHLERALAGFKAFDFVARNGPLQYDVIVMNVPEGGRAALHARLAKRGAVDGVEVRIAIYPESGRRPRDLLRALGDEATVEVPEAVREIVVRDPAMEALHRIIDRVAPSDLAILILGETGVGKEIMADAVHKASARAGGPLVRINCASLSEGLVESELFGHERGAFTGAESKKPGIIEAANRGTVFLDEVGELPLSMQSKLLRAIETGEVMRVGGRSPIPVDVRFVSATNRDLSEEIQAGTFRLDLYYRLDGVTLHVPPLRDRSSEIDPLCHRFAVRAMEAAGFPGAPRFEDEAGSLIRAYPWPGNVRELKNTIERAVYLSGGAPIAEAHLPATRMKAQMLRTDTHGVPPISMPPTHAEVAVASMSEPTVPSEMIFENDEHRAIVVALAECHGNQTRTAKHLGISRGTLLSRLDRYNIKRPRKNAPT